MRRQMTLEGCAIAAWVLGASTAWSADFTMTPDHPDGCTFELTGPIVAGDLNRLKSFARAELTDMELAVVGTLGNTGPFQKPILCLNSPGGSLSAAVEVGMFLRGPEAILEREAAFALRNLATMVPRGAVCESACAVLFMAGQYSEGDHGRGAERYLHREGRLGFHAPSLAVPDANYTKAAVDQAFEAAVEAIGILMRNARTWEIEPELLTQMISTPPDEMAFVTNVETARAFRIALIGEVSEAPARLTRTMARHACMLAMSEGQLASSDGVATSLPQLSDANLSNETWSSFDESAEKAAFQFGIYDEGGFVCEGEINLMRPYYGSVTVSRFSNDADTVLAVQPWMMEGGERSIIAEETRRCALADGNAWIEADCLVSARIERQANFAETLIWRTEIAGRGVKIIGRDGALTLNSGPAKFYWEIPDAYWAFSPECISTVDTAFCLMAAP